MKKKTLFFSLTFLILFIMATGCTAGQPENDTEEMIPISGLIYEIEAGKILVVSDIEDVNIPRQLWFEGGKRAIYFAVDEDTVIDLDSKQVGHDKLARGQKVDVWHEGFLAESYPEQGKAIKISIVENKEVEECRTDSGRYMNRVAEDQIGIKISGVPEELPARIFTLKDEAKTVLDQMELQPEDTIMFRYLPGGETEGLIFDLRKIND
ncbi:MAG: hypothetical protein AVO34_01505 [Firmicutes bacterium ML8_F2]|jgi:hypothetical protein|nr:MAG: hypothetical protein AVO34_01505 [Firmicutes bacterium ML8_F2]